MKKGSKPRLESGSTQLADKPKRKFDPSIGKPNWYKPGESGNPSGRPKRKPFFELMEKYFEKHPEKLAAIIERCVTDAARKGGQRDRYEIRDMFDGKPVQQIAGPNEGAIPVSMEGIDDALINVIKAFAPPKDETP